MNDQTTGDNPDVVSSQDSRPSVLLGVAHLTALWALAIVQPMLSLLGDSPEFFVTRSKRSPS